MNFSPDNKTTLQTLLDALGNGVSGEQVAPILSATLQAQAQQQADRQARYQEMASNVVNMAGQGMTYGATENMVDALTPRSGIPGKFQGLIDTAYANPDIPAGMPVGGQPYAPSNPVQGTPMAPPSNPLQSPMGSQLQSPLYTQNPASGPAIYNPETLGLFSAEQQGQYGAMSQYAASQPTPPNPTDTDNLGTAIAMVTQAKNASKSPQEIADALMRDPTMIGPISKNLMEFGQVHPDIASLLVPTFQVPGA